MSPRHRWVLVSVAAVSLIGATALSSGRIDASAIATALANPLSVFAARSPGARPSGALTQTKLADRSGHRRPDGGSLLVPSERMLATVRTRQPGPSGAGPSLFPATIEPAGEAPADIPIAAVPVSAGPVFGGGDFVGPPGIGGPPIIGGTTPPGGGGGVIVTPLPSVVPEPATWLMMLAGFFAIGAAARSRRAGDARRYQVATIAPEVVRIPPRFRP